MILPIYAYGHPVLKKVGVEIDQNYENLNSLIENMWETMYNAKGVGLAAPQIGLAIRLFIVDTLQISKDKDGEQGVGEDGIKKIFINPIILAEHGEMWNYEEGCLSIPNINGDVSRLPEVRIKYFNENFMEVEEAYSGLNARVIQHEYDHIEGKLFVELLSPLKKKLIQRKLENIRKGNVSPNYKMKFV